MTAVMKGCHVSPDSAFESWVRLSLEFVSTLRSHCEHEVERFFVPREPIEARARSQRQPFLHHATEPRLESVPFARVDELVDLRRGSWTTNRPLDESIAKIRPQTLSASDPKSRQSSDAHGRRAKAFTISP